MHNSEFHCIHVHSYIIIILHYALPHLALVDSEIQADLTTSSETRSPQEWTTSFVGDQQELDSIFKDLLRAFPTPTTEGVHYIDQYTMINSYLLHPNESYISHFIVFATDLCHELFIAVAVIGNSLDTLVKEVASTQSVS